MKSVVLVCPFKREFTRGSTRFCDFSPLSAVSCRLSTVVRIAERESTLTSGRPWVYIVRVRYRELIFTVPADAADQFVAALFEVGVAGVEERDSETYQRAPGEKRQIVVWIAPDETERLLRDIEEAASHLPEPQIESSERDDEEWRDVWKRYFTARPVGRFLLVPTWEPLPESPLVRLRIDPGRAFGTGGHASTRLCLQAIGDLSGPNRFLDVGCGSGVLSIACALLFTEARGIGLDVDADAPDVSRENAAQNRVDGRIDFSAQPLSEVPGPFDAIFANIEPNVLEPMAPHLVARLAKNGVLILSGILTAAAPPVEAAYRACGLTLARTLDEEGWRALVFEAKR